MPDATRRITVLLAGLIALLLVIWFAAPPAYRSYKLKKAKAAVTEVEAALKRDDLNTAGLRVRLALALAPTSPVVQRAAAHYCMRVGSPAAMQYWQILLDAGNATRADRIEYARTLVRFERPAQARQLLVPLLEEDIRDPECLQLSIHALLLERRVRDALRAARMLVEYHPDNDDALTHLGELLLLQPEPSLREQGESILWGLSLREGSQLVPAIALLSQGTNRTPQELALLARRLPKTNDVVISLLRTDILERAGHSPDRARLLSGVLSLIQTNSPLQDRLLIADWLLGKGFHQPALDVLPDPLWKSSPLAVQRHLQALANLDRWKELGAVIEDKSIPLSAVLRDVYRAVIASRLGTPQEVASHLSNAAQGTRNEPSLARLVAVYAEAFDQPRIAAEALQSLMGSPSQVPIVAPEVMRLLSAVDDTRPVLQTLDRLLQFSPRDENLLNERAWWHAVTGQQLEPALGAATELVQKNPANLRFTATLALVHLRQHDPEKALIAAETPFHSVTNPPPRLRLAYSAALGASGQREAARRIARSLDLQSLRSAEKHLIADWINPQESP